MTVHELNESRVLDDSANGKVASPAIEVARFAHGEVGEGRKIGGLLSGDHLAAGDRSQCGPDKCIDAVAVETDVSVAESDYHPTGMLAAA